MCAVEPGRLLRRREPHEANVVADGPLVNLAPNRELAECDEAQDRDEGDERDQHQTRLETGDERSPARHRIAEHDRCHELSKETATSPRQPPAVLMAKTALCAIASGRV